MKWELSDEDYDRLNSPPCHIRNDSEGAIWEKWLEDDQWLRMGYVPTPTTRLGWFIYHIVHGLLMHYPLTAVLVWSWRNTYGIQAYGVEAGDQEQ